MIEQVTSLNFLSNDLMPNGESQSEEQVYDFQELMVSLTEQEQKIVISEPLVEKKTMTQFHEKNMMPQPSLAESAEPSSGVEIAVNGNPLPVNREPQDFIMDEQIEAKAFTLTRKEASPEQSLLPSNRRSIATIATTTQTINEEGETEGTKPSLEQVQKPITEALHKQLPQLVQQKLREHDTEAVPALIQAPMATIPAIIPEPEQTSSLAIVASEEQWSNSEKSASKAQQNVETNTATALEVTTEDQRENTFELPLPIDSLKIATQQPLATVEIPSASQLAKLLNITPATKGEEKIPAMDLSTPQSSLSTTPQEFSFFPASVEILNPQLPQATPEVHQVTVNANFSDNQWQSELTEKIQWMSSQHLHKAEIHLNPQELGPISAQIKVTNGNTHINQFAMPWSKRYRC